MPLPTTAVDGIYKYLCLGTKSDGGSHLRFNRLRNSTSTPRKSTKGVIIWPAAETTRISVTWSPSPSKCHNTDRKSEFVEIENANWIANIMFAHQ